MPTTDDAAVNRSAGACAVPTAAATATSPNPKLPTLPALTSVRYFLALFIIYVHYRQTLTPRVGDALCADTAGTVAVTAFFTLSGFILAYQYWNPNHTINVKRFFQARVARIVPVYWFATCVALLLKSHVLLPPADALWGSLAATALLLQSWIPGIPGINPPAYSLSIEAFFYALFPFVVGICARRPIAAALVSLAISCTYLVLPPDLQFWGAFIYPVGRLSQFVFGLIAGVLFLRWRENVAQLSARVIGLLEVTAIVVCCAFWKVFLDTPNFQNAYLYDSLSLSLFAAMASIAFFALGLNRGLVARALAWAPLVVLGEASYSLYLLHDIFIRVLKFYELKVDWNNPLALIGFVACASFLSYLCLKFIEVPWRAKILAWKGLPLRPMLKWQVGLIAILLVARGVAETSWLHDIRIANAKPVIASSITFQDGATLDRAYLLRCGDGIEMTGYWRSGTNPKRARRLAVHILNAQGDITHQYDHDLMPANLPLSGTELTDRFVMNAADVPAGSRIGLACYDDPKETLPIEGGTCDWGGHRLLVPVNESY